MSAEKQALIYLDQIFAIIRETLEDAKQNRKDARQLTNEENKALQQILRKIRLVSKNLDEYLKQFRIQTSLYDFKQD
jgi:ABC-type transporter Mla subunit MlaD